VGRTPRDRARLLWRWSAAALVLGAVVAVLAIIGITLPVTAGTLACPALLVAGVLLGALALNVSNRRSELVWIVAGILIFWIVNSTVYMTMLGLANSTLDRPPAQELIDLMATVFTAGVIAIIGAVLVAAFGWLVRPGRWNALNGPGGQS
jgi:hypothetical protein